MSNRVTTANLWLVLVTLIWGATFPLIHAAVENVNATVFVATRLLIASLFLLPFAWKEFRCLSKPLLLYGFILAVISGGVYITQTVGLETISSARSAFITGISVVLVPLLQPFFKFRKPNALELLSALLCLSGLYILTGANLAAISVGDVWTLGCALFYALSVLYLQVISHHFKSALLLTFLQMALALPLFFILTIHQSFHGLLAPAVITGLLFCAIISSGLGLYLQVRYQQKTTAAKAALIYSLEPVFASLFGYLLNGEKLGLNIWIGGGIILSSLIIPELLKLRQSKHIS